MGCRCKKIQRFVDKHGNIYCEKCAQEQNKKGNHTKLYYSGYDKEWYDLDKNT
jgi:hypothetical protein